MRATFVLAVSLAVAGSPRSSKACAPAPRAGDTVRVATEEAIVVWDESKRVEHFIRRAAFTGTARDFGFLVPTPTQPTLAAASDGAFLRLEQATRPAVTEQTVTEFDPGLSCLVFFGRASKQGVAVSASPVRVLDSQRVGGYDAVVLEADAPDALAKWLLDHGYEARASLTAWLAPYVAAKWKLTAFKVAPTEPGAAPATSAVRMTFATDKPFFPYREPEDQRTGPSEPRVLDVWFVSTARYEGAIGPDRRPWPGVTRFSRRLAELPSLLGGAVPPELQLAGAWLTHLRDESSPRPGTEEVYFTPAGAQVELTPPAIVVQRPNRIPIPIDLLLFAGVGIGLVVRMFARRAN